MVKSKNKTKIKVIFGDRLCRDCKHKCTNKECFIPETMGIELGLIVEETMVALRKSTTNGNFGRNSKTK